MRQLQALKETVTVTNLSRMATAVPHGGERRQSGYKLKPQVSRSITAAVMCYAAPPRLLLK